MTNTLPITKAREELPKLVDNASKKLDEYIITVNGTPAAVLMSVNEYESWKETLEIVGKPGLVKAVKKSEKEIEKGKGVEWDKAKKSLGWN